MFFNINPIAELSANISYESMQLYIILMIILVIIGTVIDMIHKKSAQYFFENAKKAKANANTELSTGDKASIAIKTIAEDVVLSAEFCNTKRRIAHILTMYGFILFVATTAIMIFNGKSGEASTLLPKLWHLGAAMLALGSWWFWLFIRVDVVAEGNKWYHIERMDLFSLALMATSAFALIWSYNGGGLGVIFALFILSSTVLFGSVFWSKFAHMFFKPAAAYNKRTIEADGSRENLPAPADKPEIFGLGIGRSSSKNY